MLKKILFLTWTIALFSQVLASVGNISLLRGEADINRQGDVITAINLMDIENKDNISTKKDTKMQISFQDDTIITLGSSTTFSVNEYLEDGGNSKANFSIASGAFKVMTGKIGKLSPKEFMVKTVNATIGVRGTIFVGEVNFDASGKDYVSCLEGSIVVKSNKTGETTVLKSGEMVIITLVGTMTKSAILTPKTFSLLPKYNTKDSIALSHKSEESKQNSKNSISNQNTISKSIEKQSRWNDDLAQSDYDSPPTSLHDMNELVNSSAIYNYSGSGSGTFSQTQKEGSYSLVSQGSVQANFGLKVDFGGNSPTEFSIKNQKIVLTSVSSDGSQLSQNQLADLSNQLNSQNTDNTMQMDSTNIDTSNASLTANKTTTSQGVNQKVEINGNFKNPTASNFEGNMKQTTNVSNGTSTIDSQINANFDLSRN